VTVVPPVAAPGAFTVRWQTWTGWTEHGPYACRHGRRKQPPVEKKDFASATKAAAFADELRARYGGPSSCVVSVTPVLPRPSETAAQPALTKRPAS
jgi:hypothetical protein